ncbi:MAG: DUF3847 domain-containing protein [Oscillibacter sp.]
MPKKKLPQTIEECNAELERTQKLLQQYENRNKMLNHKLSAEKRKERNHRIFLFGGFMESLVPELKTMTEDEGKDFLYHIAKSTEAQEYLKNAPRGWRLDNTLGNKGALIHPCGCCALCRGLVGAWKFPRTHIGGLRRTGKTAFSLRQLALSTLLRPHETEHLAAASCSVSWG